MRQNKCIGKCLPGVFKNAGITTDMLSLAVRPLPLKQQTGESLGTWFQTNTDTALSGEFYL